MSEQSVKVAVRIRPLSEEEFIEDGTHCVNAVDEQQIVAGTDTFFTFDYAFGPDSSQVHLYETCVADLLHAAFEGFNATILAYGQTGSGKTWTMGSGNVSDLRSNEGGDSCYGIIPRVIHDLFEMMHQKEADDPTSTYRVHVQFLEIYGEDIRDLLDPTKTSKVTIRETAGGDVFVSGAREEVVSSAAQMMKTLDDGTRHRMTASTLMNVSSSRSHAIFTVFLEHTIHTSAVVTMGCSNVTDTSNHNKEMHVGLTNDQEKTAMIVTSGSISNHPTESDPSTPIMYSKEIRRCKFTFVDLAGSERAKRTGAQGQQMKEGIDINKGLLALGNVISALGDDTKRGKVHVPYRVSKITRILQDSLGGNSKTLMICCVSPSGPSFYESLNALRYANRARNIQNKPVVNRDPTLVLIDELKQLVTTLATELLEIRKGDHMVRISPHAGSLSGGGGIHMDGSSTSPGTLSIAELEAILSANVTSYKGNNINKTLGKLLQQQQPQLTTTGNAGTIASLASRPITRRAGGGEGTLTGHSTTSTDGQKEKELSNATTATASASMNGNGTNTRADQAEFELKRVTEQLKLARLQASELSERVIMIQSERDFYAHKWAHACPVEAEGMFSANDSELLSGGGTSNSTPSTPVLNERDQMEKFAAQYLREIDSLRRQLAEQQQLLAASKETSLLFDNNGDGAALLEAELSFNVAEVIAQTERHLIHEAKRLRNLSSNSKVAVHSISTEISDAKADMNRIVMGLESEFNGLSDDRDIPDDQDTLHRVGDGIGPSQLEEDEMTYQRRHRMMTEEMTSIGEQLQLKEALLGQLRRSQQQYGVMKLFYEQKLHALYEEMNEKQEERDRLMSELQDLERNTSKLETEALRQKNEQERRLRMQLSKKDEELRALKRRQEELSNLSKVQSRYQSQVGRLENDIETMRKQKVELTKSLQGERKKHFAMLTMKAREIDRLRHELTVTAGEAKKLNNDKLRAEERVREAMKDTAAMRKRVNDVQRYGSNASGTGAGPSVSSSSDTVSYTGRHAKRVGGGNNTAPKRVLSEQELHVKQWLDRRIQDINAREEAAEKLRKQCEQQLALLSKKQALEKERQTIYAQQQEQLQQQQQQQQQQQSGNSIVNVRDVILGEATGSVGLHMGETGNGSTGSLSKEEEEALQEIEDRLDCVEGQLRLRHRNISEMEDQLIMVDEEGLPEKTLEALKTSSAGSLPAAHDIIRLLFDMLVGSKSLAQKRYQAWLRSDLKERQLKGELDDLTARINAMTRAHDMELTRAANEYEEKLQGLFTHSAVGQAVFQESGSNNASCLKPPSPKNNAFHAPSPLTIGWSGDGATNGWGIGGSPESLGGSPNGGVASVRYRSRSLYSSQGDSYGNLLEQPAITTDGSSSSSSPRNALNPVATDMRSSVMLEVAVEQAKLLRARLERETTRYNNLHERVTELETIRQQLQRDVEEKCIHVRFLEDERQLFKDMADNLRAGLLSLGNAGQHIVKQMMSRGTRGNKTNAMASKSNGGPNHGYQLRSDGEGEYYFDEDGEDEDEDDTDSVLGAFDHIGDVITRTGSVSGLTGSLNLLPSTGASTATQHSTAVGGNMNNQSVGTKSVDGSAAFVNTLGSSGSNQPHTGSIYDRLTNPSNFTGAMKNVFEQDLAEKRQKVQLIKSGQFTRKDKDGTDKGFVFLNPKAELQKSYLSTRDCLLDQGNGNNQNDNNNNLPTPPSLSLESTWGSRGSVTSVHSHGSSDQHLMGSTTNNHPQHVHVSHAHPHHHNHGPIASNTIGTTNTKNTKTITTKEAVVIDVPSNIHHHHHGIIREIPVYPATTISPIKTQASPIGSYNVNSGYGSPMHYHTTPLVTNTSMTADLTYALSPRAFETKSSSTEASQQHQQQLSSSQIRSLPPPPPPPSSSLSTGQQQGEVPSALTALGLGTALTNWFRRGHITEEESRANSNSSTEQHLKTKQHLGTPERKQQSSSGIGTKLQGIPRISMIVSPTAFDNDDDSMDHEELGIEEDKKEVDNENEKLDNRYNPMIAKPIAIAANHAGTATNIGASTGGAVGQGGRRQSYAALLREQRAASSIRNTVSTSTNKSTASTTSLSKNNTTTMPPASTTATANTTAAAVSAATTTTARSKTGKK